MGFDEGCGYDGCEDVATDRHILSTAEDTVEVGLCRPHRRFVEQHLADPDWRITIAVDEHSDRRVRLVPPRAAA